MVRYGRKFKKMSKLDDLRTRLTVLFHLRKERINAISFNRRKSQSPTTDEGLISHAALFEQWGFMDYIAARTLLLKGLDASVKLTPKMFYKLNWEQVHEMQRVHAVNLSVVGQLIWPACALAATAVEKYAKAIVSVQVAMQPLSDLYWMIFQFGGVKRGLGGD